MLKIVVDNEMKQAGDVVCGSEEVMLTLDSLAREGARKMIMTALLAEVEAYINKHAEFVDEQGHRLVVRNGYHRPRGVTVGSGTVEVKAPRINDKRVDADGAPKRFSSAILPRYARRSPKVDEVLPVLYLRGLSTGDFKPALESLLGSDAQGLSATAISRLTKQWEGEYKAFRQQDLSDKQYAYIWVDGIYFNIRLEEDRLCALVIIGVLPDGSKELIAIEDGYREDTETWLSVLRGLRDRGMRAPLLAIGDGALGFWKAVAEIFPQTKGQLCTVHKLANILSKLPKRLQPKAKRLYHEIIQSPTREAAEEQAALFVHEFEAKYPKATQCLLKAQKRLLAFYDFPAEHWRHIRSTNIIESVFSTVRLRTQTTKGAGSRTAGLVMAYKLIDASSRRWQTVYGKKMLSPLLDGEVFQDGVLIQNQEDIAA